MVAPGICFAARPDPSARTFMKDWSQRPPEVAHLINPAFCGLLLREFVRSYTNEALHPADFSLLFIALPLVLHGDARRSLPKTMATTHHAWLENHQFLRIGFAERCKALVPYVKEALVFGCHHRLLQITDGGQILDVRRRTRRIAWGNASESAECLKAAALVGRWLAHAGQPSTIYSLWGIKL